MDFGVMVPQGYLLEYRGWPPAQAWARSLEIARQAEELGFDSLWLVDHFHTNPTATDAPMFESFTALSALAGLTHRVQLGHLVACAGYRNPALVAKMISTMDIVSGGRMVLGIGAGWKEDEWRAYGFGFPPTRERLRALADQLAVITAMLTSSVATYEGTYASVNGAINLPRREHGPGLPVVIGGNGPNVTWRLAARFADELNLDGLSPIEVRDAIPVIRSRCEEIGRDPATLRLSVQIWSSQLETEGQPRVDLLGAYAELGLARAMGTPPAVVDRDGTLELLAEDARSSGITMAPL